MAEAGAPGNDPNRGDVDREELRATRAATPPPSGFEEFWEGTRRALAALEPNPRPLPPESSSRAQVDTPPIRAEFRSWDDRPITCWFSGQQRSREEAAERQRPLLVTTHGYANSTDPERVRRLSALGFDVVAFDVRGFGASRNSVGELSPHGYILTGASSPETSVLRGAVCDYLQAARAAIQWFGRPGRLVYHGFSFAGALALMATAVISIRAPKRRGSHGTFCEPDLLAIGAPSLGQHAQRVRLCESGSGKELADFIHSYGHRSDQSMLTMSYFDSVYFAPFVHCRVIAGVGLFDPVVPAMTVYAIYNALPRPPELHEMPCSHTSRPEEQQWIRWDSAWIRATQGRDGRSVG